MADGGIKHASGASAEEGLTEIERMLMSEYEISDERFGQAKTIRTTSAVRRAAAKDSSADVTSLDDPDFEVQAWMAARRDLRLDILLQQQKGLRSDIAKLKSNTQTLVHDNYSRFIAAADIVRTMRSEFEVMVGDTNALRDKVDGATHGSAAMNQRLHVRPCLSLVCLGRASGCWKS
jgi:Vps51/Vps67